MKNLFKAVGIFLGIVGSIALAFTFKPVLIVALVGLVGVSIYYIKKALDIDVKAIPSVYHAAQNEEDTH